MFSYRKFTRCCFGCMLLCLFLRKVARLKALVVQLQLMKWPLGILMFVLTSKVCLKVHGSVSHGRKSVGSAMLVLPRQFW